jgi:S-disulfanyl-L-cysteine oxidoreductase SoxD
MSARAAGLAIASVAIIGLLYSAVEAYQADRSVWDGVYTAEQAARGDALWADTCAKCHGPDMTGGDAPSLVGSDFSGDWNDLSLGDLADRMRASMPQDNPRSLSPEQTADLVAAILHATQMPAGQTELSSQPEALKQIKYLAKRPER